MEHLGRHTFSGVTGQVDVYQLNPKVLHRPPFAAFVPCEPADTVLQVTSQVLNGLKLKAEKALQREQEAALSWLEDRGCSYFDPKYPAFPLSKYTPSPLYPTVNVDYPGLQWISKDPQMFIVNDFASGEECQIMIEKGHTTLSVYLLSVSVCICLCLPVRVSIFVANL